MELYFAETVCRFKVVIQVTANNSLNLGCGHYPWKQLKVTEAVTSIFRIRFNEFAQHKPL